MLKVKGILISMGRAIEKTSDIMGVIASYAIMGLIGFLTINVATRYFLKMPFAFTEEITGYILTFIVFIGLAHTMKVGAHVITTLLIRHLSERTNARLIISRNFIGLIFAAFLAISAWRLMIKNYVRETIVFGALETPAWIPNLIFVVGSTVFLLAMIVMLVRSFKRGD